MGPCPSVVRAATEEEDHRKANALQRIRAAADEAFGGAQVGIPMCIGW